ncbi:alpha/beta fold hydrolase [Pararhizobium sp. IMCC21322]|uniref:alpha/beta fold hydrolase n=1 Tax=Pararhizobium sp. IMCC21322 TaxID=3067903 RepID=UPI0027424F02|nr:alpha/beta hydrolase [Pararhizobium sp. IMCC21322]
MLEWKLTEEYQTSAGRVSAGRCGEGPDLILAHGWPWSSYSWHRLIPQLAKTYKVHWYDMPGYGQSEKKSDQRTSLDVQGEIFVEMLAHWGINRPTVIAHDFGGATTLRAHLLHGCDFERYVLMNVVAMRPWGSEFFDHVGKHVDAFEGLPSHIHKAIVEAYIQGALVNEIPRIDFENLAAPWLTNEGASSFYRQFALADEKYTAEVEPLFGDIRCPVKIVWGEDDPWIPIERGKELHRLIGQNRFETMSRVGHLPQLESPQTALKAFSDFI